MSEMTYNAEQTCGNCSHYGPTIQIASSEYSVGKCLHSVITGTRDTESVAGHYCRLWKAKP